MAERGPRHWRKLLKNGDVRFFFAVDGQTACGSGPGYMVDGLQEMFESSVGAKMPPPDWKAPTAHSVDLARAERTRGTTPVADCGIDFDRASAAIKKARPFREADHG